MVDLAKLPSVTRHPRPSPAACRFRAGTLKALAHPSRLLMLEALVEGERCVGLVVALSALAGLVYGNLIV